MSMFGKIAKGLSGLTGGVDSEVMQIGRPAQAVLLQVRPSGTTVEIGNGLVERVCEFTVQVIADDVPSYNATVRQRIPEIYLARFQPDGVTRIAAKVHPQDPQRVVLDFAAPPPSVRMSAGGDAQHSAAHVLAVGQRGEAVIVSGSPLNMTNQQGVPVYLFILTVMPEIGDPFQVKVGNPTPPSALPLIFPGSRVPVRYLPESTNSVVIDWANAGVR